MIHKYAYGLSFVDQAARLAFVPTAGDVNKVAKQLDDGSYWVLTSHAPATWATLVASETAEFYASLVAATPLRLSASQWDILCTPEGVLLTEIVAYKLKSPDNTVWDVKVNSEGTLSTAPATWGVGAASVSIKGTDGSMWSLTITNAGALVTTKVV